MSLELRVLLDFHLSFMRWRVWGLALRWRESHKLAVRPADNWKLRFLWVISSIVHLWFLLVMPALPDSEYFFPSRLAGTRVARFCDHKHWAEGQWILLESQSRYYSWEHWHTCWLPSDRLMLPRWYLVHQRQQIYSHHVRSTNTVNLAFCVGENSSFMGLFAENRMKQISAFSSLNPESSLFMEQDTGFTLRNLISFWKLSGDSWRIRLDGVLDLGLF